MVCLTMLSLIVFLFVSFQENILAALNRPPLEEVAASSPLKLAPVVRPFSSSGLHAAAFVDENSSEVIIKIFNFTQSQYFSVFAEVPETYNIAGHQVTASSTNAYLEYRLYLPVAVPLNTPAFKVSVYTTEKDKQSTLVDPSPFWVTVPFTDTGGKGGPSRLPPCQASSDVLLSDGIWRGPKATLRDSQNDRMRTGWNFEPDRCNLEVFTMDDINTLSKQVTIAVLGTSVQRGIFLSLVDLLTLPSEKAKFAQSKVAKCWGRAEVQVGSVKLIYQDMRATRMRVPTDSSRSLTCDGDKLSGAPEDLFQNATEMVRVLLRDHNPDVIVSHSGCDENNMTPGCLGMLSEIVTLGAPIDLWNGTWVATDPLFNGLTAFPSKEESVIHRQNLQKMIRYMNDTRFRVLESTGLSGPMELYAEHHNWIRRSQHYHSVCNTVTDEIRVCSNVTEAVAQVVLGIAAAPRGKAVAFQSIDRRNSSTQRILQACYDCPESLLPFHIKSVPNLACEDGFFLSEKAGDPYVIRCPVFCMATTPTGKTQTQSGIVEVRQCKIANNSGT